MNDHQIESLIQWAEEHLEPLEQTKFLNHLIRHPSPYFHILKSKAVSDWINRHGDVFKDTETLFKTLNPQTTDQ
jgi:hypothetical protein